MQGLGETGNPRENPPINGTVRHDSHVRKSRSGAAWIRAQFRVRAKNGEDSLEHLGMGEGEGTVAERLDCSPPTMANRSTPEFQSGYRIHASDVLLRKILPQLAQLGLQTRRSCRPTWSQTFSVGERSGDLADQGSKLTMTKSCQIHPYCVRTGIILLENVGVKLYHKGERTWSQNFLDVSLGRPGSFNHNQWDPAIVGSGTPHHDTSLWRGVPLYNEALARTSPGSNSAVVCNHNERSRSTSGHRRISSCRCTMIQSSLLVVRRGRYLLRPTVTHIVVRTVQVASNAPKLTTCILEVDAAALFKLIQLGNGLLNSPSGHAVCSLNFALWLTLLLRHLSVSFGLGVRRTFQVKASGYKRHVGPPSRQLLNGRVSSIDG
ncbi:hypothetical protein PR048_000543 [Dryococelus australis]|uniref:Uncharacterized protein n=1 Tax=Dryococelus australis TaxID=614101 RepID=A0ABQ9IEX8_9NEOP|nr:hypothetical protein PR048_000543 [Dryococelus australis]